jgi:hypothetical protein
VIAQRRVARLAVRELWMTFRLLLVLVAFVGCSAVLVLLPAAPRIMLGRLAVGLGVATIVAAGIAGWSLAAERLAGRAGWLVTRSVSRGEVLSGWFLGLTAVVTAGVLGSGLLGWLAVFSLPVSFDPLAFVTSLAAVAATAAAAIALGLALGSVLRPPGAAGIAVTTTVLVAVAIVVLDGGDRIAPGAAFRLIGDMAGGGATLADALRATGIGLVMTAVLLSVARLAMDRAEL